MYTLMKHTVKTINPYLENEMHALFGTRWTTGASTIRNEIKAYFVRV